MKFRLSKLVLFFTPFLILLAAFAMDRLEVLVTKEFAPLFQPEIYLWWLVLIRFLFALMVFAGVTYLLHTRGKSRFYSILWLGLGFVAVFLATPWGNYLRSVLIHTPFLATFPNRLFFLAGAFLLMGGGLNLILLASDKQNSE